jgi:N-acetylneuraminic acid mutarotase
MKKLVALLLLCSSLALGQGTWTQMNNFPGQPRSFAVGFSIGTKGYMGTGSNSLGINLQDFWEYDPSTDTWTQKASFGGIARSGAVGFAIGTKGYIGTGINTSDFWEYNPSTNAWTQRASYGGGSMSVSSGFGISSTAKGYLGGTGLDNLSNFTKKFYEYDQATNTWTVKAQPPLVLGPTPPMRYYAVEFSIGTKGYLSTGGSCCGGNARDLYEYNPATNSWLARANYTTGFGLWEATGFSVNGKGYLVTGEDDASGLVQTMPEYNPSTNTWSASTNFAGTGRVGSVSFVVNNCAYVVAGRDGSGTLSEVWRWCPAVLPVELISFSGKFSDGKNILEWKTATEKDNSYFTLERSDNAETFEEVTRLNGAGNSKQVRHYEYADESFPASGKELYYRLKFSSVSNQTTYSDLIKIETLPPAKDPSVYYNPLSGQLYVFSDPARKNVRVEIFDLYGSAVFNTVLGGKEEKNGSHLLTLPALAPGFYLVRFSDSGDLISQRSFIK